MIYSGGKAKLMSLGAEVKKAYSFGELVYTSALYKWLKYIADRNEITTYTWNVYTAEKNYVTTYIWNVYNIDTEYTDNGWGAEEYDGSQSVTGYTSMSFSSSSGFSGSGWGTLTQTGSGSDVYSVNTTSVTWYYYTNGAIYRRSRTCSSAQVPGSYVEQVSSTTYAYPANGTQGGYWYVLDSSSSAWDGSYRKGSYTGTVSSQNASAYPQNGYQSGNWYADRTSSVSWDGTYKQGAATGEYATNSERTAYPDNGYQGGYWWVYDGVTQ